MFGNNFSKTYIIIEEEIHNNETKINTKIFDCDNNPIFLTFRQARREKHASTSFSNL
jgi:hypothetical protein